MWPLEAELDRCLTLIRNKIRAQGFTQLEVQEALGWGRSYISQLLTKQKALRVEQVLLILDVIDVDAAEFFAELYPGPGLRPGLSFDARRPARWPELEELRAELKALVEVLIQKGIVTGGDVGSASRAAARESLTVSG